jgi:16S rRNA G966 N2-methylase RsmD
MKVQNALSDKLGIRFINKSYDKLQIPDNSLIYCDPPYERNNKITKTVLIILFSGNGVEIKQRGHIIYVKI